jgi:hypothetical protein
MRYEASKRNAGPNRHRPTARRINCRTQRAAALPNAMDVPDPGWLPEPLDEWDGDSEIVARFASAIERD